jgi:hypothetical protein
MTVSRWLATSLVALSATAQAQVEWFNTPDSSNIGALAEANGHETKRPCTFGTANPPKPLTAWYEQFSRCDQKKLSTPSLTTYSFLADHPDGHARFVHPSTGQESKMLSIVKQTANFSAYSMTLEASVGTRYSGQLHIGNRAVPRAWGDVLFRVPARTETTLVFDATLGWQGNGSPWYGTFQVISAPTKGDTRKETVNFGYHPLIVRKGASTGTVSQAARLEAGNYRLTWSVYNDAFDGPKSDGEVRLDMSMKFTDETACKDSFGPATLRWPADAGYTARIVTTDTDEYRYAPECNVAGAGACWKQRKVTFEIQKGDLKTGPYTGWAYVPNTFRKHKDATLSCKEMDPRYNCHGFMFAGSMLWIEQDAVDQITRQWCDRVPTRGPDEWSAGEVRLWRVATPRPEYYNPFPYYAPDHSQMMSSTRGRLDEKLGFMAYERPERYRNLTRAVGTPEHYRCRF